MLSTARENWVPFVDSSRRIEDEEEQQQQQRVLVKTKVRWDAEDGDSNVLDFRQPSQADWIRQYVEQQEEVCIRRVFLFFAVLLYFYMHLFVLENKEMMGDFSTFMGFANFTILLTETDGRI